MYIDNTERLFKDLKNIDTIRGYMEAVEDDGMQNDLSNLISIINDNLDKAVSGDNDTWSTEDLDYVEVQRLKEDYHKLLQINHIIQREKEGKYKIQCNNCNYSFFFIRKPKYNTYICPVCKKEIKVEKKIK